VPQLAKLSDSTGHRKRDGFERELSFFGYSAYSHERMLKRSARFSIPNILIEIQVRNGRDDEHVGGNSLQSLRTRRISSVS
jgi:hypothetical protein